MAVQAGSAEYALIECTDKVFSLNYEMISVDGSKVTIKTSKTRWLIIAVYIFYCGISAFQWVEYSIVGNIIARYYHVTVEKVDYTAMAYMLFPIPLVIPGSHIAERIGLRWTNIVGSGLICLGSWVKIFSVHPDRFLLTLGGQSFLAVSQDEPKYPPSETRALQKKEHDGTERTLVESIKRLMTNASYLILCNSYGLGIGVLNALSTMLNQIVLARFEDGEEFAGRLGLIILVMGMFGSITFGLILDKTQKFKETTVTVYLSTLCSQIFFTISILIESNSLTYIAASILGFFISGYLALGYEMCAEYTYPESESLATGILNIGNNLYGIILILVCSQLKKYYGDVAVHICLCSALLVGLILTVMTKDEQRRQNAKRNNKFTGAIL
ncbi:feline leukemia virus subgroup C receptor-related protein 2 isoform X2 [Fopius arisanus]|uniref:Feline leukemia virus subgroup C receptor-related protein 2 isoform X2 n=1 Tax=Fopius arisanus TaxID=64838 RepID=A0A9R1TTD9_9HYME|nr:PREDICTED: feline leukemia virus subgroup C receptor-related protein 2-like isoform X2 [Fopius arisanus]